jgi:UDP-GlcNAc:undecaprenyl-phosphate GlcNAc-1-phosphate transferase
MEIIKLLPYFIFTLMLSVLATLVMIEFANKWRVVDVPDSERKVHDRAIPLLGGMAIFVSFFFGLYLVRDAITATTLAPHHWIGFFAGGLILMAGGFLDDKYNISPGKQVIFPVLAALCVIAGGVEIEKITSPFGGYLDLSAWQIHLAAVGGREFDIALVSGGLIFLWLMGMMYTTKLLDGVDGLVTSVTGVGALVIFIFTMTTKYFQPDIGLAALLLAASCLGFLFFNWYPAKIFLGEGGSLFLGYALGVLAIISGGKIAIALLVMGLPIMDVAWTIIRRLKKGQNPFKIADRKHLHFRLIDLGLGARATVLSYVAAASIFGSCALFLQSLGKAFALIILFIVMLFAIGMFNYLDKKSNRI